MNQQQCKTCRFYEPRGVHSILGECGYPIPSSFILKCVCWMPEDGGRDCECHQPASVCHCGGLIQKIRGFLVPKFQCRRCLKEPAAFLGEGI